jgi:hypothetical protein
VEQNDGNGIPFATREVTCPVIVGELYNLSNRLSRICVNFLKNRHFYQLAWILLCLRYVRCIYCAARGVYWAVSL